MNSTTPNNPHPYRKTPNSKRREAIHRLLNRQKLIPEENQLSVVTDRYVMVLDRSVLSEEEIRRINLGGLELYEFVPSNPQKQTNSSKKAKGRKKRKRPTKKMKECLANEFLHSAELTHAELSGLKSF